MGEIEEALKFDPGPAVKSTRDDEIEQALKFDPGPVGGTFQPKPSPFPGGAPPVSAITGKPETQFVPGSEPDARFTTMMKAGLVDDPVTKVKIFAEGRGIAIADIAKRYRIQDGKIEFKADDGKWQREVSDIPMAQVIQGGAQVLSHPSTYLATAGAALGPAGAVGGAIAGEEARRLIGKHVYGEPQEFTDRLITLTLEGTFALGGEMAGKLINGTINRFMTRKAKNLKFAGKEIKEGLLKPADHAKALYIKSLADQHGITLAPHQLYDKEGMTNVWKYLRKHPLTSDSVQEFEKTLEGQADDAIDGFIRKMGGYKDTPKALGDKLKLQASHAIEGAEDARAATAKPYYEAAFDKTPTIDTERLMKELDLNKQSIARTSDLDIPDVKTMVKEIDKAPDAPPTIKIKGEDEAGYASRISKDYQRITGKEVPMTKSELGTANIEGFKKRNEEIEKILKSGKPEAGIYAPTKSVTVDISDATAEIDRLLSETVKGDPSYTALRRLKLMLDAAAGDPRKLDRIKRSGIDNVLTKTKTNRTLTREMTLVKKQLTDAMDAQIPDYSAARGIYGKWGMAPPIDRLKESVIGQLADMEGDKALSQSVKKLFSATNMPDHTVLREARKVIVAQDPDLWRESVGAYIRDIYQDLIVTEEGKVANAVGKLQKRLLGSKRQKMIMQEAFGGAKSKDYKTFESLMTVFQRAAIGASKESMTAPFQQIEKELAGEMGSGVYKAFSTPKQFAVDKAFGWWNDALLQGRQGALLDALTAPNVQTKISKLKQLTPRGRRFWETFSVMATMVSSKMNPDYENMTDHELKRLLRVK
jgi:hypothetical protein